MKARIDKPLAGIIAILIVGGAAIFVSAAFGILAKGASHTSSVVFNHLALGVGLGFVLLLLTTLIEYRLWRPWAPYLYGLALIATALVFVPHIGFEHGGGKRWIQILGFTFQPAEFLKIGAILTSAALFSSLREKSSSWYGLLGFGAILLPSVLLLIAQPDIGTLGVICIAVLAIFTTAGARLRDIGVVTIAGLVALSALAYTRPYMLDRVTTFLHPAQNQLAEGYQIKQSLIAIGSGGIFGRGFGQGVQKFTYLPEPMGDSIFAVVGEEIGFIGGVGIIGLFLALALRGFSIASRVPDLFGALTAVGISAYFVGEAFINIASMVGIAPLTGIPLTFISQGGSAMLVSLASAGILLNISQRGVKR